MNKLIQAFVADPTDRTRARLQAYLNKHTMAVCMASPVTLEFLTINGFKV